jgi:ribosomal protein L37AE/L43A
MPYRPKIKKVNCPECRQKTYHETGEKGLYYCDNCGKMRYEKEKKK